MGVPVALTGTFAFRTATRAFRTIQLRRLRGVVTFNRGGPVECGTSAPARCEPSAVLSASSLVISGTDVLEGEPPRILVRPPAGLPVVGRAPFDALGTTDSVDAGCRTRTTEGAWSGALTARFAAWGVRTFGAAPTRGPMRAVYRESAPE